MMESGEAITAVNKNLKKMTFFSGVDLGLTATVHAVKSLGAHAIATARETGTLLRSAHSVVQVAETPSTAHTVLQTLVLITIIIISISRPIFSGQNMWKFRFFAFAAQHFSVFN